jgi:3-oxoacyl-[acyl-carrier-protein] synthase I
MKEVFVVSDNILSPLGTSTEENFSQLKLGVSGIKPHTGVQLSDSPVYASLFDKSFFKNSSGSSFTKFEQLLVTSISSAIKKINLKVDADTALIISSTKGNISLLETKEEGQDVHEQISLHHSAALIAKHFQFTQQPIVVSHACISGLLAIITGLRLLQSGQHKTVVIAGADIITRFIYSGFQSFQAISNQPCKPFDADRTGINLGEGAATVILSTNKKNETDIKVLCGSVSNDANHISGPSRSGEELFHAIQTALQNSGLSASDIDFISAHGTATIYNDEMEAKAFTLAGLSSIPVNSLKGYYGHTLGAAGLIESVISIQSLKENIIIASAGYKTPGVSKPLNICRTLQPGNFTICLKTASGFGGCNAAVIFSK